MSISTSIWGDGGWKPNIFDFHTNEFCTFLLKYMTHHTVQFMDILNIPHECPVASVSLLIVYIIR